MIGLLLQQVEALRKSEAHWERLASGKRYPREAHYGDECECCIQFAIEWGDDACENCPLYIDSGLKCGNDNREAMWDKANNAFESHGYDSPEFKAAAGEMLAYITRLRTEYETKLKEAEAKCQS